MSSYKLPQYPVPPSITVLSHHVVPVYLDIALVLWTVNALALNTSA